MQVRIEIADTNIETRTGKSSRTGQEFTMHKQEAYLHNGHKYPERFELTPMMVDGKPVAYPPGFYTVCPSSLRIGEYKDLEINRYELKLLRLDDGAAKAK